LAPKLRPRATKTTEAVRLRVDHLRAEAALAGVAGAVDVVAGVADLAPAGLAWVEVDRVVWGVVLAEQAASIH
jgi:hypothetical protein